ncbi:SH3 domain-binding glutamic acid-rich-like protein 2 [Tympanuchus pallidicinctus]|uniref:SH3 domain-binding glutamic acid-rich-like protein 2 n=1 Tax=Tympanuchus pallidicinctus TaxID=109042 RepID=UPI002286D5C8|nr:SH3 domain-binding glutamic acid-rich-like protein 2 [Tympanuchus pallidicinctus]
MVFNSSGMRSSAPPAQQAAPRPATRPDRSTVPRPARMHIFHHFAAANGGLRSQTWACQGSAVRTGGSGAASRSGASPFPSQSTTVQSRRTTLPVGRCAPPPPFPPPAVIASQRRGLLAGEALPGGRRWRGAPGPRAAELRSRGVLPVAPSRGRGAAHEVKMVIRVFVASSSGSVAIKKRQQDVVRFLEANRIEFEEVDITMSEEKRQWMYKNIPEDRQPAQGNPLPPQIFSDDRYCGDYDCFFESKESNTVFSFLGLKPSLAPKES